jgi:arginase
MNKNIGITNVRLDLGAPRRGAAAAPAVIHDTGIVAALEALGHRVVAQHEILQDDAAGPGDDPRTRYLDAVVSACARLADTIELSLRAGRFPLIVGGDHSLAMGSVAGLVRHFRPRGLQLGVLWVDAHADMNTPETSPSGCLHGMPLAALLGHGADALTRLCGGSPALDPSHVVLFGIRDVDRDEELVVQRSGVRVFRRAEIARRGVDACLTEALDRLRAASAGIHLSFDLDACDPSLAPGVTTPVHHGLDRHEALAICDRIGRSGRMVSLELVELNPSEDAENRTGQLAVQLAAAALARPAAALGNRGSRDRRDRATDAAGITSEGTRRVGILAHSLYREMRAQGFVPGEIVGFASALLGELLSHVKKPGGVGSL